MVSHWPYHRSRGEREDDISYERSICSRAAKVGVAVTVQALDASCTDADLHAVIAQANADASVHGILLFRPLLATLDEARACAALDPAKDVDCLTPQSLFGVFARQPVGYRPCTVQAIIEMLEHADVPLSGANVVVVGRSLVVGRPVSMMLQAKDATVTMCHTKTRDLAHVWLAGRRAGGGCGVSGAYWCGRGAFRPGGD